MNEEQIEALAHALHDHYRDLYKTPEAWDDLPEVKRELNRAQVRAFPALVKRHHIDADEALAAGVHDVWMHFYENRADPRMRPYADLPESEKRKDREIVSWLKSWCFEPG